MASERYNEYEGAEDALENTTNAGARNSMILKSLEPRPPGELLNEHGILCYETFFINCLTQPDVYSGVFVEKFEEILQHLLALGKCDTFNRERNFTYFFNAIACLYMESGNSAFKNKFIEFLSSFFIKNMQSCAAYRPLYNYSLFKMILSLTKADDFRIREFVCNTDFVDILFELPDSDPLMTLLKWKFLDIMSMGHTKTNVKSIVGNEVVRSFVKRNMSTEFGAIRSIIQDISKTTNEHIATLFK